MIQKLKLFLEFHVTVTGHLFSGEVREGIYFFNNNKDLYFEIKNKERFEVFFHQNNIKFITI